MGLSRRLAVLCTITLSAFPSMVGAQTLPTLFFNPLVRENSAGLEVQALRFVAVDGFAPFSAFDENGKLRGVHVDLARAVCAELKIDNNCTLQAVAFNDVANLLASGQADIALAGLVPTEQNRKALDFSVPYFRYPSKFLIRNGLTRSEISEVGVIAGSVHEKMAGFLFPKLKLLPFASEGDAVTKLNAGTLPALFGDGLQLAALQSAQPLMTCCTLQQENYFLPSLRTDTLSAAISNKRPDLLVAFNTAIRQMAGDGRLEEIYLRHMPESPLQ